MDLDGKGVSYSLNLLVINFLIFLRGRSFLDASSLVATPSLSAQVGLRLIFLSLFSDGGGVVVLFIIFIIHFILSSLATEVVCDVLPPYSDAGL